MNCLKKSMPSSGIQLNGIMLKWSSDFQYRSPFGFEGAVTVHAILHVSQSGILEGFWCFRSSPAGNRIAI